MLGVRILPGMFFSFPSLLFNLEVFGRSQRDKLLDLADDDPRFSVRFMNKPLCPSCAQVLPDVSPTDSDEMVDHLLEGCPKFDKSDEDLYPLSFLKKRKRQTAIRHYLQEKNVWQCTNQHGKWICPFCMDATDIDQTQFSSFHEFVQEVISHLNTCYRYEDDPSAHHDLQEVKEYQNKEQEKQSLAEKVREKIIDEDARYTTSDKEGKWICPFCLSSIPGIDTSSQFSLEENSPPEIARHLQNRCEAYQNDRSEHSPEEIREVTQSPDMPSSDSKEYEELSDELQHLRNKVKNRSESSSPNQQLQKAQEVQSNLLPDQKPLFQRYELGLLYRSTDFVGGDFYDFLTLNDNATGFMVADVSGHGLQAALIMSLAQKSIRIRSEQTSDISEIMAKANDDILTEIERGKFISCFFAKFWPDQNTMEFASAGHTTPLFYRDNGNLPAEVDIDGPAFGLFRRAEQFQQALEIQTLEFSPGDVLFIYTDGITEGKNKHGEEFGIEKLKTTIYNNRKKTLETWLNSIWKNFNTYISSQSPDDDITLFALQRIT